MGMETLNLIFNRRPKTVPYLNNIRVVLRYANKLSYCQDYLLVNYHSIGVISLEETARRQYVSMIQL